MRTEIAQAMRPQIEIPSSERSVPNARQSPFPRIALCTTFRDERDMYMCGLSAARFRVASIDDADVASATLRIVALNPQAVVIRLYRDPFGIDLTRRLRERRNFIGTPIVLLTTNADDATHNLACAAGATAIYMLPLLPTELAEALHLLTDQQPS